MTLWPLFWSRTCATCVKNSDGPRAGAHEGIVKQLRTPRRMSAPRRDRIRNRNPSGKEGEGEGKGQSWGKSWGRSSLSATRATITLQEERSATHFMLLHFVIIVVVTRTEIFNKRTSLVETGKRESHWIQYVNEKYSSPSWRINLYKTYD